MRYKKPKLCKVSPLNIMEAVCASGNEASIPASCTSGPEAGGGGCASGVAAPSRCVAGAAAGSRCDAGTGFAVESETPAKP